LIRMQKRRKGKKAVIFSIDAILALVVTITLISASFFYLSQIQVIQWSQPNYFLTALDTLNILRSDGTLRASIKPPANGSSISTFMNAMYEDNICGSMTVQTRNGTLLYEANKTNCTHYNEVYVYRSSIVVDRNIHNITLKLWYQ